MIASVGITNIGIASSETALEFEAVTQSNTINEYPVLHYCREGVTVTYLVNDTVGFFFQPSKEINNVKTVLPYTGYDFGDPIDGTEGLICEATVFDSTGAIAVTADGIVCEQLNMLGYNTTGSGAATSAILSLEKGFAAGRYSYELWYDSSISDGGIRVASKGTFNVVTQGLPAEATPYQP